MEEKKRKEILDIVNMILDKNATGSRIDIVELANKLGFSVYRLIESAEPDGIIMVDTSEQPISDRITSPKVIAFKASLTEKQNRFIIAHELGHYYLHTKDMLTGSRFVYAYHQKDKKESDVEQEADFFAANLLVPEKSFKEKYESYGKFKDNQFVTEELSNYFGVNIDCIEKRKKEIYAR